MPVDAGPCYPNDKVWIPVATGFSRGLVGYWGALVVAGLLLMQQGLTESLAGRFEVLRLPHWSFTEMREAFGFTLEQFLLFGGYPGAAPLVKDPDRWRRYILDTLIETTISRRYSGQILSYTKMLGQLQEAGNTTTLAHYLDLLAGAGMLTGIQKYAGQAVRRRASSPKLQVLNTALLTAQADVRPDAALADREFWGRLTESAVGAHLAGAALRGICEVFYWRERNREVDFVVKAGNVLVAIEVKSGRTPTALPGLAAFADAFAPTRTLLVGGGGIPVQEFLEKPVETWLRV